MRIFNLVRFEDESGVSGSGVVAEGIEFSNKRVAITWLSDRACVGVYDHLEDIEAIHGHGGKTKVVFREFKGK